MGDGTDEPTVEKSTEELLSETDDILGEIDAGGADVDASDGVDAGGRSGDASAGARGADASTAGATTEGTDDRRFRKYFDPASAGVSGLLVLAGAFFGGMLPIPFIGGITRLVGVGAATFLHGATASESRYAETFVASTVVGFLFALITTNLFVTLSGIGVPLLAVSTVATVLVALVGHYFGRDLRRGLTGDVEGGNGGGSPGSDDDVPGW